MSLRKLPWPCSRIERDVLHELWQESQRSGQPITEIIKVAVDQHLTAKLDAPRQAITFPGIHQAPTPAA